MLGWLHKLVAWWNGAPAPAPSSHPTRLERVLLTDGVAHTLFDDYTDHRRSPHGDEEIGWILLGVRQDSDAIVLAAIPAGTGRDAGEAHIQFDADAQALATLILRQSDRRLTMLGVVHTHPGRLRTPSDGDLRGDREWVQRLRTGDGVFAIGTADARTHPPTGDHVQIVGDLCFSWYALGADDARYRPLAVQTSPGVDLAASLRPIWETIELHAETLLKLHRLFAKVQFAISKLHGHVVLTVTIALAKKSQQLHLLLDGSAVRYYCSVNGEMAAVDPEEPNIDRAIHLILAELAKEPTSKTGVMQAVAEE